MSIIGFKICRSDFGKSGFYTSQKSYNVEVAILILAHACSFFAKFGIVWKKLVKSKYVKVRNSSQTDGFFLKKKKNLGEMWFVG